MLLAFYNMKGNLEQMSSQYNAKNTEVWFGKHLPNAKCPMCQTVVGGDVIRDGSLATVNPTTGDENIHLTCSNCAYVMAFDSRKV